MKPKVRFDIKAPLRQYTENKKLLESEGGTVMEALQSLLHDYPRLKEHLFTSSGTLNDFVNIFVNGEDIRARQGLGTILKENDLLSIMPAIAGGNSA